MLEWKISDTAGTVTQTDGRPEAERDLAANMFTSGLLKLSTTSIIVTSLLFN